MTTYSPTTAAQIVGHLNGGDGFPSSYESGDIIAIPAGNYTLTADINPSAGRLAGVTVAGAGKGITVLSGRRWLVDLAGGRLDIDDLTIDVVGQTTISTAYGSVGLRDGRFDLCDVEVSGLNTTGNLLTFIADDTACVARMLRCHVRYAELDCVSTKAPGGIAVADMSMLTILDSAIWDQGSGGSNQCLTTHDGFGCVMVRGSIRGISSETNAVAPDNAGSPLRLDNVAIVRGLVNENVTGVWNGA